jgi:hypothetical protein
MNLVQAGKTSDNAGFSSALPLDIYPQVDYGGFI